MLQECVVRCSHSPHAFQKLKWTNKGEWEKKGSDCMVNKNFEGPKGFVAHVHKNKVVRKVAATNAMNTKNTINTINTIKTINITNTTSKMNTNTMTANFLFKNLFSGGFFLVDCLFFNDANAKTSLYRMIFSVVAERFKATRGRKVLILFCGRHHGFGRMKDK